MDGRKLALGDVARARDDARARGAETQWMPILPPAQADFAPDDVDAAALRWAETVAPGGYSHLRVARGTRIRLKDVTGDACASVLLFNAAATAERLNVADTQKIPWQAYLGHGHPLLSGEGRVLATVVADTSGHHDAFCGASTDAWNAQKYGDGSAEGPSPSGHALLRLAAAKHDLSTRDLPPAVSFFQGLRAGEDGALHWQGSGGPGASVDLRAELPLIVLIANAPHPLDPRDDYVVGDLRVLAWADRPTDESDAVYAASPERTRAYLNTLTYAELAGL